MKVLSSLCLISLLFLSGCNNNTRSSGDNWTSEFGDTCYAKDPQKRQEADDLFVQFKQAIGRMREARGNTEEMRRHAIVALQKLEASARIGNPVAFVVKCHYGMNSGGNHALQLDGVAWCMVGTVTIPKLASFSTKLLPYVNKYSGDPKFKIHVGRISAQICR